MTYASEVKAINDPPCPSPRVDCNHNVTWELDHYNSWNLPFAKWVELRHNDTQHPELKFPQDYYLLGLDPSAYFSVIFVPDSFEHMNDCDACVTLNFT